VAPRDGLGVVGKKEVLLLSVMQPVTIHYIGTLPETSHLLYGMCFHYLKTQKLLLQTLKHPGFTMMLE
jgi:hypothetical protein